MEPYKTSEMAKDALDLLNFLRWDQDRSIHVFGVSLGGMISQELVSFFAIGTKAETYSLGSLSKSLLIPSRIKSMTLISTRSGNAFDFPSVRFFNSLFQLLKSGGKIRYLKNEVF
jgi:pimeloyl-ACP methyl ester carboxylesterase